MSKVVSSTDGWIKMPINEPSSANSQIQEFIDEYRGPGVQHIALLTPDILATIEEMRRMGQEFLEVPDSYYDENFEERVGTIDMAPGRLLIFPSEYFHAAYHPQDSFFEFPRLTLAFWMVA